MSVSLLDGELTMRSERVLSGLLIAGAHLARGTVPPNAFIIHDYPDGFRIKCKKANWVERADKGAKKGEFRLVTATSDERHERPDFWRQPHAGNYYPVLLAYQVEDPGAEDDGHIHIAVVSAYDGPLKFAEFQRRFGASLGGDLDYVARALDAAERISRRYNATSWREFDVKHKPAPVLS
jgi:hypothetical protein